jgi:hypothetical protein
MIAWRGVCLHHSFTKDSETLSWPAIAHHHTKVRGWQAIGYHFGVERFGHRGLSTVQVLQGRPLYRNGAHARGANYNLIGICVVGNFDAQPPRADVWNKTVDLVATLALLFDWSDLEDRIHGHRDFSQKTCPGLRFNMDRFTGEVMLRVKHLCRSTVRNQGMELHVAAHGMKIWKVSTARPL